MSLWLRGILALAALFGMVFLGVAVAFPLFDLLKWDHSPSKEEKERVRTLKQQAKQLYKSQKRDDAKIIETQIIEIQRKNPENSKKQEKKGAILTALSAGLLVSVLLAVPAKIISPDKSLISIFSVVYLVFGAPSLLLALFVLFDFFKEKDGNDHKVIYAYVIYYGTAFIRRLLSDYVNGSEIVLLAISAAIITLICVAFWLNRQKTNS